MSEKKPVVSKNGRKKPRYKDSRWQYWAIFSSDGTRLSIKPQWAVSDLQALHKARIFLGPIDGLFARPLKKVEEEHRRALAEKKAMAKIGQLDLFKK